MRPRFSAVAGTPIEWGRLLDKLDRQRLRLPQRELNFLLDALVIAQDAEREAQTFRLRPRERRR